MSKKVLITPLDWGLGHATRCIPVIRQLQAMGHTVVVAGSGPSVDLLRLEFPNLRFFDIPSYDISYSRNIPLLFYLLSRTPALLSVIRKENERIKEIVEVENIDAIISDNRYGCFHEKIPSAIIIHQLSLQLPMMLKGIADNYNTRFIRRFNECWVPDTSDRKLSGALSGNKRIAAKFIGPLSRFTQRDQAVHVDILGLISGPEPQRTRFEELLNDQLSNHSHSFSYKIVRGLPGESRESSGMINHLPAGQLNELIASSEVVICRPGYSTIMDLAMLKKKAIFVPTPGQTEQVYLAKYLETKRIAPCILQQKFSLPDAMSRLPAYTGFTEDYFNGDLLSSTLREFLD